MPMRKPAGRAVTSGNRATGFLTARRSKRILIVCEGKQTEPNYFQTMIRVHKLNEVTLADSRSLSIDVKGAARSTLSLTEYALSLQTNGKERYEEIWCVFDKDDFMPDAFDNAVGRALNHEFLRVAWSNEAFELWFVLHFQYLDTAALIGGGNPRDYYRHRLDQLMRSDGLGVYKKNDPEMYTRLGTKRRMAADKNARRLLQSHPAGKPCHQCIPATTIHLLVEHLLSYEPEIPRSPQTK